MASDKRLNLGDYERWYAESICTLSELESVIGVMGLQGGKPLLMAWGNKIRKGSAERRLVVVSELQIGQFKPGQDGTLSSGKAYHFLDLKRITTVTDNASSIVLRFAEHTLEFRPDGTLQPDIIMRVVARAHAMLTVNWPLDEKLSTHQRDQMILEEAQTAENALPFGGFIPCYQAFLTHLDNTVPLPTLSDLQRFIIDTCNETIALHPSEGPWSKVLSLENLAGVRVGERRFQTSGMVAACLALRYNAWFSTLMLRSPFVSNVGEPQLSERPEMGPALASLLLNNRALTQLILRGIGLATAQWDKVCQSISSNRYSNVSRLDLSNNRLKDSAALALAPAMTVLPLEQLLLQDCGIKKKGMTAICTGLRSNSVAAARMTICNMSGNAFGNTGTAALVDWLAGAVPAALLTLLLNDCELDVPMIIKGSPLRALKRLQTFEIAGSQIPAKSTAEFADMVAATRITTLNVARARMNSVAVRKIMDGLASGGRGPWTLDISGNPLGYEGIVMLELFFQELTQPIEGLILESTDIPAANLPRLCACLAKIRFSHLDLSSIVRASDQDMYNIMEVIANLIRERRVTKFRMAGSERYHLELHVLPLLKALLHSRVGALTSLDISGNQIKDEGAAAVANFLKADPSITFLNMDRNQTSLTGIVTIARALEENTRLLELVLQSDLRTLGLKILKDSKGKKDADPLAELRTQIKKMNAFTRRNQESIRLRNLGPTAVDFRKSSMMSIVDILPALGEESPGPSMKPTAAAASERIRTATDIQELTLALNDMYPELMASSAPAGAGRREYLANTRDRSDTTMPAGPQDEEVIQTTYGGIGPQRMGYAENERTYVGARGGTSAPSAAAAWGENERTMVGTRSNAPRFEGENEQTIMGPRSGAGAARPLDEGDVTQRTGASTTTSAAAAPPEMETRRNNGGTFSGTATTRGPPRGFVAVADQDLPSMTDSDLTAYHSRNMSTMDGSRSPSPELPARTPSHGASLAPADGSAPIVRRTSWVVAQHALSSRGTTRVMMDSSGTASGRASEIELNAGAAEMRPAPAPSAGGGGTVEGSAAATVDDVPPTPPSILVVLQDGASDDRLLNDTSAVGAS